MIQAKCTQKFRDKNNKIYGYRLIDLNGNIQDVTPDDLKKAILENQINVINLTLTSDNRLIDKEEDRQLANEKLMPNKVVHKEEDKVIRKLSELSDKLANTISIKLCNNFYGLKNRDTHIDNTIIRSTYELNNVYFRGERQNLMIQVSARRALRIALIGQETKKSNILYACNIDSSLNINKVCNEYIDVVRREINSEYLVVISNDSLNLIDSSVTKYTTTGKVIETSNHKTFKEDLISGVHDTKIYPYRYNGNSYKIIDKRLSSLVIAIKKNNTIITYLIFSGSYEAEMNFTTRFGIITDFVGGGYEEYIELCSTCVGTDKACKNISCISDNNSVTLSELKKLINRDCNTCLIELDITNVNKDKKPYEANSYSEFMSLLIPLIENTFKFTGSDKFTEGDTEKDNKTGELTWMTGMMGDFIYDNKRCYIDIGFSYDVVKTSGFLSLSVVEYFEDSTPLYEGGYNFSGRNMKANFSHMLKESQKFIQTVMNKWKH